ncbi:MAG TPA: hypothetical protein VJ743_05095 [Albitalea sp.]|nr:hypothetical protein [Albitalea sp.]
MITIALQSSLRTRAPRLAQPLGGLFAAFLARLEAAFRPREDSPAQAAARLRRLANQYSSQPSFAADLRAAADRHEQAHGIE